MITTIKSDFAEIKRQTVVLDRCLDGHPGDEVASERKLKEQLYAYEKEIARFLSMAGISRGESGPDATRRHKTEMADCRRRLTDLNVRRSVLCQEELQAKAELADLSTQIQKTGGELKRLEGRISELERNIDNRILLAKLWFLIFPDADKAELARKVEDRNAIRSTLDMLRAKAHDLETRHNDLKKKLSDLSAQRNGVDGEIRQLTNQIDALDHAIQAENERECCAVRLKEIHGVQRDRVEGCAAKWKNARGAISGAVMRIREKQPKITDLAPESFGCATSFPDMFSVGTYLFSGGGQEWALPRLLPFPFPRPLLFPPTDKGRCFVQEIMLRAFQCIPPDTLEITVCDPKHLGNSLAGFLALLENRKPFPDGGCLTTPKDIEDALSRTHAYMAAFVQRNCVAGVQDWASFNAAHPDHPAPCKLLVMFDLPEQLTGPAAACLTLILENGPKCGVFPLIACDVGALDSRRDAVLIEALSSSAWDAFSIRSHVREFKEIRNIMISEDNSRGLPDANGIESLLSSLKAGYKRRDEFAGEMDDLYRQDGLWSADSRDGIEALIGWSDDNRTPVRFVLGSHKAMDVNHALLGGKTGSGKSNLIHVLVHGLCHRYSPEELNLYLLDYKDAIEFNDYAMPLLPHARLVATKSDVDFGISVLRHLETKMTERNAVFQRVGVSSLYEYRNKTGEMMPRILLVIDEFQKFFEDQKTADVSQALLMNLAKQGRSAGIHLLLATQSLVGLSQVGTLQGLTNQLACRLVLSCRPEDSRILLGQSNEAAAELKGIPQGILNNANGAKSANMFFNIPEAKRDIRERHLSELHNMASSRGFDFSQCRVFNGNCLPAFPMPEEFNTYCSASEMQPLLLGRMADFNSDPVIRNMAGQNLCVVGRRKFITDVKRAIAESLSRNDGGKAIILYSEHPENWDAFVKSGCYVQTTDEEWTGIDLDGFARREEHRKLIILDGIEDLISFHPDGYKPSPLANMLASLVSRPAKTGVQLILCARDYRRAQAVVKELLIRCGLRIGDSSIGGDLTSFVCFETSGSRALPPLPEDRAIVVDRDSGESIVFRPFGCGKGKEAIRG